MIPRLVAIVVLASAALAAEPQPLTRAIERANRALPPGPVIESIVVRVSQDGTPAPPTCFYRAPAGQSVATQEAAAEAWRRPIDFPPGPWALDAEIERIYPREHAWLVICRFAADPRPLDDYIWHSDRKRAAELAAEKRKQVFELVRVELLMPVERAQDLSVGERLRCPVKVIAARLLVGHAWAIDYNKPIFPGGELGRDDRGVWLLSAPREPARERGEQLLGPIIQPPPAERGIVLPQPGTTADRWARKPFSNRIGYLRCELVE